MVEAQVLRRRIAALLEYIRRLERFSSVSRDRFIAEPTQHDLAERYLHLAIESAIDIAHHIIADGGYEAPETYRDAFAILAKHALIDGELSQRMQAWAGLRNILVHAYLDIDHGITHDALARDLGDLRAFAAAAARLL